MEYIIHLSFDNLQELLYIKETLMPYDEGVAHHIREKLEDLEIAVTEKKMFGGLAFLFQGNMLCGIIRTELMVRIDKDSYDEALQKKHAREMDFTGRAMKGFLYISEEGISDDAELVSWLQQAFDYVKTLPSK